MSVETYTVPGPTQGSGRWSFPGVPIIVIDLAGSPESYRVAAMCMNCKWEGQMRLRRGSLVTSNKGIECPKCGCGCVTGGSLIAADDPENDSRDLNEKQRQALEEYGRRLNEDAERTKRIREKHR